MTQESLNSVERGQRAGESLMLNTATFPAPTGTQKALNKQLLNRNQAKLIYRPSHSAGRVLGEKTVDNTLSPDFPVKLGKDNAVCVLV